MLFWKLLLAADVLVNIGYWRAVLSGKERLEGLDLLCIPIGLIGTLGLATYAFTLPTFPQLFWRGFLPIFIALTAWEISKAAVKSGLDWGTLVGVGFAMLLVGLTSVALYRLGGSAWIGAFGI